MHLRQVYLKCRKVGAQHKNKRLGTRLHKPIGEKTTHAIRALENCEWFSFEAYRPFVRDIGFIHI